MSYYFNHYLARRMASAPRGGGGDGINIPTVFQRVEYIQSDGNQWINLGVIPTSNTRAVIDAQYTTSLASSDAFGAYHMGRMRFHIGSYLSKFHFGAGGESNWVNLSDIDTSRHTFTLSGDGSCSVDDTVGTTGASQLPETSLTLYLFALNYQGVPRASIPLIVYRCQIYESDSLAHDFIPCYRKSDHKPGLWDMVTWSFYTNANTSALTDFTVGPDVLPRVPIGYTLVEYLQSSGAQYIDTGFKPDAYTSLIEIDCAFVQESGNQYNGKWNGGEIVIGREASQFFLAYGGDDGGTNQYRWYTSGDTARHNFRLTPGKLYIDDNAHTVSIPTFTDGANVYLFAYNDSRPAFWCGEKIYASYIIGAGGIVHNYYPVRDGNNVGYLYDSITEQLLPNSGSGSFTLGPDI